MNKLNMLKKAEALSILYKYGFSVLPSKETKEEAGKGATIGGAIGGIGGIAGGLAHLSNTPTFDPNKIVVEHLKQAPRAPSTPMAEGDLFAQIAAEMEHGRRGIEEGQRLMREHGDPGTVKRLLTVMKQKGWLNTLGKAGKVGLITGGIGAGLGAAVNAGIGAYKRHGQQSPKGVPNKKRRA